MKSYSSLLQEVAAMNPIQDDHNEDVVKWCAFCGVEVCGHHSEIPVVHKKDCLWVRIREELDAKDRYEQPGREWWREAIQLSWIVLPTETTGNQAGV